MSYSYSIERPKLFTEEGQKWVIDAWDKARSLLDAAGAFNGMKAVGSIGICDTFTMMAVLDRLVEMGRLREISGPNTWGQHRVFVRGGSP